MVTGGHGGHHMDRGHSKGPSLDRQITVQVNILASHWSTLITGPNTHFSLVTVQDVECLREAFALFDPDKEKEVLTPERLGKVRE